MPDLERYTRRQQVHVVKNEVNRLVTDYSTIDPVAQVVRARHVVIENDSVKSYPVFLRYCWPSELDLMATIGGLELEHRWNDWTEAEFTSQSGMHISVYRQP